MAFKRSDADAIKNAITEAVKSTLERIDPANGGTRLRESEQDREVRLKEERREKKYMRESARQTFESSGMTPKQAKKAAKSLESPAYQARYRG
jgi:hypothetical protein